MRMIRPLLNFIFKENALRIFASFFLALQLSACLTESKKSSQPSLPNFFDGAISAISKGDSSYITWNRTTTQQIQGFNVYLVKTDGSYQLLQRVGSTTDRYTHVGLTPGKTYRYLVKAINLAGSEDGNIKIVGTVNYPGIINAYLADGVLKVSLSPIEGDIEEVRIYAELAGETKKLVKTVSSLANSADLESVLRSGTTYSLSAQAFNSLVGEDGNTVTKKVQTPSITFAQSNPRFRGFQNTLVYGDVPNWNPFDPDGIRVKTREATIQWRPFLFANTSTKYTVYRVGAGGIIDFSATNTCTSNDIPTCVLCATNHPVTSCRDITIQKGKTYDYVVTQVLKDSNNVEYPEEIPLEFNPMSDSLKLSVGDYTPYRLQISTPPDNMVMIPRDGVNFEYCSLMGRPARVDRNMSCSFNGPGNKPSRVGEVGVAASADRLVLDDGYFDIGYNFMMDRFGQACNWSRSCSPGSPDYNSHKCGKCGPGGTDGNCVGHKRAQSSSAPPPDDIGIVGNVYYRYSTYANSFCWVKTKMTGTNRWSSVQSLTPSDYANLRANTNDNAYTPTSNSPRDGYAMPLVQIKSSVGAALCGTTSNEYGTNRMLRLIEARAAIAAPWITGDINYKSESQIREIEANPSMGSFSDLSNNPTLGCFGWISEGLNSYMGKFNINIDGEPDTRDSLNPITLFSTIISTMVSGSIPANLYRGTTAVPYERILLRKNYVGPTENLPLGANFGFYLGAWATSQCTSRYGVEQYLTSVWSTGETIPSQGVINTSSSQTSRLTQNQWDSAGYTLYPAGAADPLNTKTAIWNNMKTNWRSLDVPTNYTSTLDSSNDSMAGLTFGEGRTILLTSSATTFSTTGWASAAYGSTSADLSAFTGISGGGRDGAVGSIFLKVDDPLNVVGVTPHGLPVSATRSDTSLEYIPSSQIAGQLSPKDAWAIFPIGSSTSQPSVSFAIGSGRRWSTLWVGDNGDARNLTFRCATPIRPRQ